MKVYNSFHVYMIYNISIYTLVKERRYIISMCTCDWSSNYVL